MNTSHTPGPWISEPPPSSLGTCRWIRSEHGTVALVGYKDFSTGQAADIENAALIAKAPIAPKLAEALRLALSVIPKDAMIYSEGDHGERVYPADVASAALAEWDAQS